MSEAFVYVQSPVGVWHVMTHRASALRGEPDFVATSLCGRRLNDGWLEAEETVSGSLLDCQNCRRTLARLHGGRSIVVDRHESGEQRVSVAETARPVTPSPAMRADRLATEIARRWSEGEALGRPSIYNVAREVLIDEFTNNREGQ